MLLLFSTDLSMSCFSAYQLSVEKYLLPVENDIILTCKQINIDTFCPNQAVILLMLLFMDTFLLLAIFSYFFCMSKSTKRVKQWKWQWWVWSRQNWITQKYIFSHIYWYNISKNYIWNYTAWLFTHILWHDYSN